MQVVPLSPSWQKMELKIISLLLIKSSPVDRYWGVRCLYNRIDLPDIKGSFTSGANTFLVAKFGTKDLTTFGSV